MENTCASNNYFSLYCCNPFKKSNHGYLKKYFRTVNDNIISCSKLIRHRNKIFDGCCKAIHKLPKINEEEASESNSSEYHGASSDTEIN